MQTAVTWWVHCPELTPGSTTSHTLFLIKSDQDGGTSFETTARYMYHHQTFPAQDQAKLLCTSNPRGDSLRVSHGAAGRTHLTIYSGRRQKSVLHVADSRTSTKSPIISYRTSSSASPAVGSFRFGFSSPSPNLPVSSGVLNVYCYPPTQYVKPSARNRPCEDPIYAMISRIFLHRQKRPLLPRQCTLSHVIVV